MGHLCGPLLDTFSKYRPTNRGLPLHNGRKNTVWVLWGDFVLCDLYLPQICRGRDTFEDLWTSSNCAQLSRGGYWLIWQAIGNIFGTSSKDYGRTVSGMLMFVPRNFKFKYYTSRCGFKKALLFQEYGDSSRKNRKLLHGELSQVNSKRHVPLQYLEVLHFVQRIGSSTSVNLADECQRYRSLAHYCRRIHYWTNLLFVIREQVGRFSYPHDLVRISGSRYTRPPCNPVWEGHGIRGEGRRSEQLSGGLCTNTSVQIFSSIFSYANHFYPCLISSVRYLPEWMPGSSFIKEARTCRELLQKMMSEPYEMVLNQMVRSSSFLGSLIRDIA